jgi:hypothetical protein
VVLGFSLNANHIVEPLMNTSVAIADEAGHSIDRTNALLVSHCTEKVCSDEVAIFRVAKVEETLANHRHGLGGHRSPQPAV